MNMHVSQTAQASAFFQYVPFFRGRRHVRILLCTHNGASYLRAQLDSYLAQEHTDWSLWVSDDHSTDQTREILQDFAADHPDREVHLLTGIGRGHAANYLSLMCHPALPKDGFVALSDQDDVWLPDRLSRGMARVAAYERRYGRGAILYGGRTRLVGADMTPLGLSRGVRHAPSFHNALVQNVMAGNTLLMSPEALALVRRAGPDQDVVPATRKQRFGHTEHAARRREATAHGPQYRVPPRDRPQSGGADPPGRASDRRQ